MMNSILSIDIKKWYLRFAVVNLLVTIIYYFLLEGFEISDIFGFNLAYHMFHWFLRLIAFLLKRNFTPQKLREFKFISVFFSIFFSIFGLMVLFLSLFAVIVYNEPFPPFTIGFAILLGALSIHRTKLAQTLKQELTNLFQIAFCLQIRT